MVRNFAVKAVHKQMYPATYTFRDEEDGTSGTDIDFVDSKNSDADQGVRIVAITDGHRKSLELGINELEPIKLGVEKLTKETLPQLERDLKDAGAPRID